MAKRKKVKKSPSPRKALKKATKPKRAKKAGKVKLESLLKGKFVIRNEEGGDLVKGLATGRTHFLTKEEAASALKEDQVMENASVHHAESYDFNDEDGKVILDRVIVPKDVAISLAAAKKNFVASLEVELRREASRIKEIKADIKLISSILQKTKQGQWTVNDK